MQPRSLDQILNELNGTYNPQIDLIRQRQAAIPGQIAEEEKGLGAKQEQAFGDILNGARRRGLGFAGIPLGEQAKYTATEYLPALARLRQSGREQSMSLEEAILGIGERRDTLARQLYQNEQDRAEQQRQFNAQLAAQQEAARRSSGGGGGGGGFAPTFGGGGGGGGPATNRIQQEAYNDVKSRLDRTSDVNAIKSDFNATWTSAIRGNRKDQAKIGLYLQMRPDLFKLGKAFIPQVQSWGVL